MTTLDNRDEGAFTYTERSKTLFSGSDSVRQGRFEFTFPVPLDINYSDEEGLLSLYALDAVHSHEAGGAFDRFLVGGTDDGVSLTDTLGPKITVYLNTPDFSPGGQTNTTPLFVAELEDADGINTVGNGIGHDLSLCIDGSAVLTYNLNDYYTPVAGDYTRGTVYFSVPELTEGKHTLSFRAWDLLNNSSTKALEFEVVRGLRPGLFSVICTQALPVKVLHSFFLTIAPVPRLRSVCPYTILPDGKCGHIWRREYPKDKLIMWNGTCAVMAGNVWHRVFICIVHLLSPTVVAKVRNHRKSLSCHNKQGDSLFY